MNRSRYLGLQAVALLTLVAVKSGLAEEDRREPSSGPRDVARLFITALSSGEFGEAARHCSAVYNEKALQSIRSSIASPTVEVNEVYQDNTRSLAITSSFPYRPAPTVSAQISLRLRQQDDIWLVEHIQVDEAPDVARVRERFFQAHPGARVVGALALGTGEAAVRGAFAEDEIVRQLGAVKYAHEYQDLYRSLFAKAGRGGLPRLQMQDDDSIAVQAAWEEVRLTIPAEEGEGVHHLDREKLGWFLGFLQGRARVSPPEWWQHAVLTARANRRDDVYPGRPGPTPYHRSSVDGVTCPRNASLELRGNSVVYRVGDERIAIPEELLQRTDSGGLWGGISGSFTDKYCFLAVHGHVGYPHDVACIDRSSGKVVWEARACGCWWGLATGIHESWVSVVPTTDNRVFVFGTASAGFYVQGFRASDGKSLIQFSNNY